MRKQAIPGTPKPVGIVFEWRDVLRVVRTPKARQGAAAVLRAAGITPDEFDVRGKARNTLVRVCDCLTRIEDWMEDNTTEDRAGLRSLRRRLETHLWP